jgi:hypothetical protein
MRSLALLEEVEHWPLTTLRVKLVKIGTTVDRHGRYVTFQLAEVAVSRNLFQKILGLIEPATKARSGVCWNHRGKVEKIGEARSNDDKNYQLGS